MGGNVCFKCKDKYFPGHRCNGQQLLILQGEKEELEGLVVEETEAEEDSEAGISMHAFDGSTSPGTIKIKGRVGNEVVVIPIDSGSNHSFLDFRIAKRLACRLVKTSHY